MLVHCIACLHSYEYTYCAHTLQVTVACGPVRVLYSYYYVVRRCNLPSTRRLLFHNVRV